MTFYSTIKLIFLVSFLMILFSCTEESNMIKPNANIPKSTQDPIIIKHKNKLDESYEVGFYSKSYSFYWLAGKDTLDFGLIASEHEKDSSLHLSIIHKKPTHFTTALIKVQDCLKLIQDDFYLSKFSSLYFRAPTYYVDLSKGLSKEYEQKFGRKNIGYHRLNKFLLGTTMNSQLNAFLKPFNKKVNRYGIEKFHLLNKEDYTSELPGTDLSDYPDFTLNGMGLYVQLTSDR